MNDSINEFDDDINSALTAAVNSDINEFKQSLSDAISIKIAEKINDLKVDSLVSAGYERIQEGE